MANDPARDTVLVYVDFIARVTRASLEGASGNIDEVILCRVRCFACDKPVRGVERATEKTGTYCLTCPECHSPWIVYKRRGPWRGTKEVLQRALELEEKGQFNESLQCCDKAIELEPNSPWVWLLKGGILAKRNRTDDAIKCHRKALELDPNLKEIWTDLGDLLSSKGNYEEALRAYDRAMRIDPSFIPCLQKKLIALASLDRFDDVRDCAEELLAIDQNDAMAWYSLGVAMANLGELDSALECLKKADRLGYGAAKDALAQLQ